MAESHVISGLISKRAELSGLFQLHQTQLRQIAVDLAHIDGAIRVFDPDYDLGTIKAKVTKEPNPWFEHGETSKLLLDVLRTSSTALSTRQLGEDMLLLKGLTVENPKQWDLLLKMILSAAERLARKGIIQKQRRSQSGSVIWQIA
jgi:hypothetical protein